tara:strand:- start:13713 stop:14429 length:717 start_codon:yes stop_codon:yes gene_type:complete
MIIKKKLDFIIPVYQEDENILSTLNNILKINTFSHNILICYDYDDDPTIKVIKNHIVNNNFIFFIKNKKSGAHGAIMTGIENSVSDYVLVIPADDDYNIKNIPDMINEIQLQSAEILCPDRFMKGGKIVNGPKLKFLLCRIVNLTLYLFSDINTLDATNGFRLFSRKVIDTITIESTMGFTYSLEYLIKSIELNYKVIRYPALWIERKKGKSRFKIMQWSTSYLKWYFYCFKIKIFKK